MKSTGHVTRRDFARLAALGAGTAVLGCSDGILAPERELVVSLAGSSRLFDESGQVIATQPLAPRIASGPVGRARTPVGSLVGRGGALPVPAPGLLAFARAPAGPPAILRQTDRAPDGTVIETELETLGGGIPRRRTVRIPEHGVELVDAVEFRQEGGLSVFARRTIEVRKGNRRVADLIILGNGEVRVTPARPLRALALGSPLLPGTLAAEDCGLALLVKYIAATLAVLAAFSSCTAGPVCLFGLAAALIRWGEVIAEMEECRET
jgi:hypothetical protein